MADKSHFTNQFEYQDALRAEASEAAQPMIDELGLVNSDKSPMSFEQIEALKRQAATNSTAYYLLKEMGIEVSKA